MKICRNCGGEKKLVGIKRPQYSCRKCATEAGRRYSGRFKDRVKEAKRVSRKYLRESPSGRAYQLLRGMRLRSKEAGFVSPEFTLAEIEQVITNGVCEVTGIPFLLSNLTTSHHNPYAPSPDRINPHVGYLKSNVQWVLWAVNRMKAQFSVEVFEHVLNAVITKRGVSP